MDRILHIPGVASALGLPHIDLPGMSDSGPLLVAYGTLMRAFGGCERLGVADRVSFVSECRFAGRLYDLGRFPGAVPGDAVVRGDLFRLHDPQVWPVLDRYEGYDSDQEQASLFVRRRVHLKDPTDHSAWVYWYNGDAAEHSLVPSGDWERYLDENSTVSSIWWMES